MIDYKILKSGSSGNCVIIEDMMFDCSIAFNKIKDQLYNIKYLFITHRHADHLKLNTYTKIREQYPRIKTIANYDVAGLVPVDFIVGDETQYQFKDRMIKAFKCIHNVPTSGFVVEQNDKALIYATDTASLENAPKQKYDYLFIESNHDEKKIEEIRNQSAKYGYNAWGSAMRHLSTKKSMEFYYLNRRNKESLWVELHKSKRFY